MRRLFSLFAALIVVLTANAQFAGGKGTAEDPYLIADAYQLADMQNYRSSYFKLINDIDLTEWIEDNSPTLGWSPIGSSAAPFTGDFDGNGFTIRGLKINRPTQDYVGLFGYFNSSNSIKNLTIQSANVIGKSYTSLFCGYTSNTYNCSLQNLHAIEVSLLKGNDYTGTICGKSDGGSIQSCGAVLNELVCAGKYGGGICGYTKRNVENCKAKIQILKSTNISNYPSFGGIVGYSENVNIEGNLVIVNSFETNCNSGNFGGIVGEISHSTTYNHIFISNNISVIQNLYSRDSNRDIRIGGICGYAANYPSGAYIYIQNCYTYCNITSTGLLAGILSGGNGTTVVRFCMSDGIIESKLNNLGGITTTSESLVEHCFVLCPSLKSAGGACGVSSSKTTESVCASDFIDGVSFRYRVSSNSESYNNKALITTKLLKNGVEMNVEDNNYNGTAYGEKTLKRSSTYVGLRWDMVNTWKINEGEDYPYLRILSDYPTITKYETTNNCRLTGTSPVNGKIYVMKDGATYTSDIVDNAFDINVGAVNVGDTLLYFSMPEGGNPSMVRRLVLTEGTIDPSGDVVKGDANGDSVVDAADVVSTVNSILGKPSSTFVQKNADINEDGQILVDDAVGTVNIIMNAQ